ncbi:hypothetical protein ACW9KT_18755 [Hymenobacter sp. HD11105]
MYSLLDILQLEDQQPLEHAFYAYQELYGQCPDDYQVWRHFYFFLWVAPEEAPVEILERLGVTARLRVLLTEGESRFATQADFHFLAGYTIAVLPYEFGPFAEWEQKGNEMLLQATLLAPENPIYRLAYLGSFPDSPAYRQAMLEAAPVVVSAFQGKGLLNHYFRHVLYRVDALEGSGSTSK